MSFSDTPRRYPEIEIRDFLKSAIGAGVPWQDVDKVKDHIAALEQELCDVREQNLAMKTGWEQAVWDMAALKDGMREWFGRTSHHERHTYLTMLLAQPHPGTDLLRRMRRLEERDREWRRVAADLQREAPPAGRLATQEEITRWDEAKATYRKLAEQD